MARVERAAALLLGLAAAAGADEPRPLTVASWGGAYERAQRAALFRPFSEQTGIAIRVARYDGDFEALREQARAGESEWDVVDMTMSDNLAACDEGLILPLDHEQLLPAPDGTPARRDFLPGALARCAVTHTVYATVVGFDRRAFPGVRPGSVAALFDLERFPGPRALQRVPAANLEWALLSYGVPRQEIYNLLSTERGLAIALERLGEIAAETLWWRDPARPPALLAAGEATMASGFNGRFFDAAVNGGAPIDIIWDGQIQEHETWAIPRGARRRAAAMRFIRFATSTRALAEFARHIPYGPARRSAIGHVSTHRPSGIDMRPHLPTHPLNASRAVVKDVEWYARTYERVHERFERWWRANAPR